MDVSFLCLPTSKGKNKKSVIEKVYIHSSLWESLDYAPGSYVIIKSIHLILKSILALKVKHVITKILG